MKFVKIAFHTTRYACIIAFMAYVSYQMWSMSQNVTAYMKDKQRIDAAIEALQGKVDANQRVNMALVRHANHKK